jgi:hypothetical protein
MALQLHKDPYREGKLITMQARLWVQYATKLRRPARLKRGTRYA